MLHERPQPPIEAGIQDAAGYMALRGVAFPELLHNDSDRARKAAEAAAAETVRIERQRQEGNKDSATDQRDHPRRD